MDQNPNPQMMLPPNNVASSVRAGMNPNALFQQSPLTSGMTPSAMGADPTVMNQPPMGSQAQNPTMPGNPVMPGQPQAGQPATAVPGQDQQQLSEAQYILNVLAERLKHHSKITEKTVSTLADMITAGNPIPGQEGQPA